MRVAWFLLAALAVPVARAGRLECVANSAPGHGTSVLINADCPGGDTVRLLYSLDYQSSWTELPMAPVGVPGYDSTYEQCFTAPGSGGVFYYVRGVSGPNFATQSPYNGANVWPPAEPLLARAANEPAGDTVNGARAWLDLTGIAVGRSDDWLYFRLTNNHTSWPLGSFPGPWYVYSVGFKNPGAPSDTWVYVVSYANAMGLYTSGLYETNQYTEEYTKLCDIDTYTSGNRLLMRCRFADFTSRPRFGPWPNQSGSLWEISGNTQSATLSQQHFQHDTTNHCRFYVDRTPFLVVGQNRSPALSGPGVEPGSGTPETVFRFSCRYSDPDSNLTVVRAAVVDAETLRLTPDHHHYWQEVSFGAACSGFAPGWHRFRFVFDDGMARVVSDPDSFLVTGTGLAGESPAPYAPRQTLQAWPNPFRNAVVLHAAGAEGYDAALNVFDAAGSLVRSLRAYGVERGAYSILWDGADDTGRELSPGVYFCRSAGYSGPVLRVVKSRR